MLYEHDFRHALDGAVLAPHYEKLKSGIAALADLHASRALPMLCLPEDTDDLEEIEEVGNWFRAHFATVLVVGTGGSSLGGQTVAALKENVYAAGRKGAPRVYFLDNVDPQTMDMLLHSIDLAETGCLVISKSGDTAEIIAQTLVLVTAMQEKLGEAAIAKQFVSITMSTDNALRRLSMRYGIRTLEHDAKLGGRFSVLSRVGLIPAVAAGLNARELRRGAAEVLRQVLAANDDPSRSAPAAGAALHCALMEKGYGIAVLMPYCDRLSYFGMWFRQLWAESLGKGGKGSTPVRALGTVDQHSQLQLYLDGPKDKFITLIHPAASGQGPRIDGKRVTDEPLAYIRDKTIGDVMSAHQHGTAQTLMNRNIPVRVIRLNTLDEAAMGALLMHFMLETVLTAHLMGVDAYDQPAVEESKVLARDYLLRMQKAA